MREDETQLRDSHQHTRDGCPQTNQQQHCGTCRHQFQDQPRVLNRRRQQSLQSPVEQPELLLLLAPIRVRFPANPREMSQKAVAIERPFIGYLHGEH